MQCFFDFFIPLSAKTYTFESISGKLLWEALAELREVQGELWEGLEELPINRTAAVMLIHNPEL